MINTVFTVIKIVFAILLVGALFVASYMKAPPNIALIISGFRKSKPRVVIGRSTIRIPFLERVDRLGLELMQVDIDTNTTIPTREYINIKLESVANVKISSEEESVLRAAENFLGKKPDYIGYVAKQVIEGNLREVIGQMKLNELVQQRDVLAEKVQGSVAEDMKRMGLEVVNLTIQNFVDENKVIQDLGVENVAQIRKDAAISKANADRDVSIAQSLASELSNKAQAEADTHIAEQNKLLAIKKAEFKIEQDTKQAEADAAYKIQEQEQRKSIEISSTQADIAKREKEVELREKEIQLKERELDALVKKQADAEKYAVEQKAEADKYKLAQEAAAKQIAMESEARGIEAVGLAEAKAIEAKAEALRKMNEVGKLEMVLKILPEIVKEASSPLQKVDSITMYGDGNNTKLIADLMKNMDQISKGIGVDIPGLLNSCLNKTDEDTAKDPTIPDAGVE